MTIPACSCGRELKSHGGKTCKECGEMFCPRCLNNGLCSGCRPYRKKKGSLEK